MTIPPDLQRIRRHDLHIVITLMAFAYLVIGVGISSSFYANGNRVSDLQRSRVESCERTYEGVRLIFKPFLPPAGTRTPKQQRDLKRFNDRVDNLKARCDEQVKGAP